MTSKKTGLKTIGLSLMALALIPTPDDVTVISPLIQFGAGLSLLIWGELKNE